MDPNAALTNARDLAATILTADDADEYATALAEAFDALDQWLSKGGFLPGAWAR